MQLKHSTACLHCFQLACSIRLCGLSHCSRAVCPVRGAAACKALEAAARAASHTHAEMESVRAANCPRAGGGQGQ